jgi:hypothetical protein
MNPLRMDETTINASLDACLHGAQQGDTGQARQLHEMLGLMLLEEEAEGGRLWLTDHGRELLAEMHRQLGQCTGSGDQLHEAALTAVRLKPAPGRWRDTCEYLHSLRVAIAVANELCEQKSAGATPDLALAAQAVADRGEFDLDPGRIREVYGQIAETVGGFREISHC